MSVRDRDLDSVVAEAQQKVETPSRPPADGYRLEWTGSFENEQRAERRLAVIVPFTIAGDLLPAVHHLRLGEIRHLILLTVPFSAAGGLLALPVAGLNMSVAALVGFIALFGVSIQNSVILVSRIRIAAGQGRGWRRSRKAPPRACGPW
jgi:heavy metal efflux system protein